METNLKGGFVLDKFKAKIQEDGRSYKWFILKYLSEYNYSSIMNQINGFTKVQNYLEKAIRKYSEDK